MRRFPLSLTPLPSTIYTKFFHNLRRKTIVGTPVSLQRKWDTAGTEIKREFEGVRGWDPVELPRFGGHLRIWEKGVHNGKESILVPA